MGKNPHVYIPESLKENEEVIEFEEEFIRKSRELTEIEKLKISQAEQFETILMIIGGM